jgi:hypothetical protein
LYRHKKLRAFVLNSVLISSCLFFMFWLYQPLAEIVGIKLIYFGFISAGYNLFAVILLTNTHNLERFFGMKNILFYTALIPAFLLIGAGVIKNIYFIMFSILLVTGFKLLRAPILSDFMNRHIDSRNRATILSSVSLLERIMIALLYPIVGIITDYSLNYALVFLGALALIFTIVTRIEDSSIVG